MKVSLFAILQLFFAFTKYREVKYDARKISRLVLLHFHVKICCIHEMVSFIVRIYECLLKLCKSIFHSQNMTTITWNIHVALENTNSLQSINPTDSLIYLVDLFIKQVYSHL